MTQNEDEINVEIKSDKNNDSVCTDEKESKIKKIEPNFVSKEEILILQDKLAKEQQKSKDLEDKLKRALADFQNLERRIKIDIENTVNLKIDQFMLEFLTIYEDFLRAKEVFTNKKIDTTGIDSILKNMDNLLSKYNIKQINALGEIFDPKLHDAISVIEDPDLDDGTITKEIRKGYISQNRIIRPSLVEISKKSKNEV